MKIVRLARGHYSVRLAAVPTTAEDKMHHVDTTLGTLWSPKAEEAFEILLQLLRDNEECTYDGLNLLVRQIETGECVSDDDDDDDRD